MSRQILPRARLNPWSFLMILQIACISEGRRNVDDTTVATDVDAEVAGEIVDAEVAGETDDAEVAGETNDAEVAGETTDAEVAGETTDAEVAGETTEVAGETVDAEVADEIVDAETENGEVEVTPECTRNSQCFDRPGADACKAWGCVAGTCELLPVNEGGACVDDDVCSTGDFCEAGSCRPGPIPLLCLALGTPNQCYVATCDPVSGCGKAPRAAGVACENDSGSQVGTCVSGGFVPSDTCDGLGVCRDASPGSAPNTPELGGEWFAVFTTFGRFATPTSGRAILDVSNGTHTFTTRAARAFGPSPFTDGGAGHFCADDKGAIEGRLGTKRVLGHQMGKHLAVVSATASDEVAVLLRADEGSSALVDGRYNYFQTTIVFGTTAPTTWHGTLDFVSGCLASGLIEADREVAPSYGFVAVPGQCLSASQQTGEGGLFRLSTQVSALTGDATVYPIDYRGAIGPNGDVLLMVKDQRANSTASTTPEYGIVILVREDATTPSTSLSGEWAYNFQARLGADPARRDFGTLQLSAATLVTGGLVTTLDGDQAISGGWYLATAGQRLLSQKVDVGSVSFSQSGFLDPSRRFVVGWNVRGPSPGVVGPIELDDEPRHGSLLLMLRPGD